MPWIFAKMNVFLPWIFARTVCKLLLINDITSLLKMQGVQKNKIVVKIRLYNLNTTSTFGIIQGDIYKYWRYSNERIDDILPFCKERNSLF